MTESFDVLSLVEDLGVVGARQQGDEITAKCPGHERILGRPDRHASWGINAVTGAHFCFSCGYRGSLESLYLDLAGEPPPDDLYERMAISGLNRSMAKVEEKVSRLKPASKDEPDDDFSWGDLVPVSDRMLANRYITRRAADAYGLKYDKDRGGWFMPLYTEGGELVGGQWKLFSGPITLPPNLKKSEYLFGLNVARAYNSVVVVESPLDAARLYSLGIPAVATLGSMVSKRQITLLNRNWSMVVVAMDNDAAGITSSRTLLSALRKLGTACFEFPYRRRMVDADGYPAKDPGDVVDGNLLKDAYSYSLMFGGNLV